MSRKVGQFHVQVNKQAAAKNANTMANDADFRGGASNAGAAEMAIL
jgi:hypothetical protein